MWTGSVIAGVMAFVGVILMSVAGLVIAYFDLSKIVMIVGVAIVAVAAVMEAIAGGFWK